MILMTGDALSGQRRDAESLLNSFVSAIFIATSRLSDNQMARAFNTTVIPGLPTGGWKNAGFPAQPRG
jgi:hypothetical protein